MWENLISFALATVALAISPGPDNMYVLTQSLANGAKSGLATTAGLISGCIVHTTLLAFGVSALLTASQPIYFSIKILGAVYLLYLAFQVWKSDASISVRATASKKSHAQLFQQGVVMNLLNPKVMIFFWRFSQASFGMKPAIRCFSFTCWASHLWLFPLSFSGVSRYWRAPFPVS